ncbi:MAG: orotidine-5'-phosphate decarboxylase, partial [Phycisphaeraceae bacterium]|nr:orotidine-5'-phosphate decarboxylase [Phycisphaeraceae bacterium]
PVHLFTCSRLPTMHFSDRLLTTIRRVGSPVCIGLDPVLDKLPSAARAEHWEPLAAIRSYCHHVIHATAPHAAAIKFQSACFERYGGQGVTLLQHLMNEAAGLGLVVILDAKRGDIGISAEHYAAAAANAGAHAITINAYLGPSTVEPYLAAGLGIFILVRTSNPDSDAIQSHKLADGRTVAELMADEVAKVGSRHRGEHGLSDVGAVVGATKAEDTRSLRARMPRTPFLVPGFGAQGGTVDDIRTMLAGKSPLDGTILVTASRSVIYAFNADDPAWAASVAAAAQKLNAELRAI